MIDRILADNRRRGWRGPGCTDLCRQVRVVIVGQAGAATLEQHHVESHEQYGVSLGALESAVVEDVLTGPLAVRLGRAEVLLDGVRLRLTPTEFRIVAVLALHLGRTVNGEALVRDAWGEEYLATTTAVSVDHILRVNLSRLRTKLGAARELIETWPGFGYCLQALPYTGPAL